MSWQASGARPRCGLDGVDNGLIAGTAAIIAGKMLANLFSIRATAIASADPAPPSAFPACRSRIAARYVPGTQPANRQSRRCRTALRSSRPIASCVCTASIRQERTISPLTRTVHAPQTPCSQPTCVPVSLRCSRRKSARFSRGSTCASTRSPLTTSEIVNRSRHADAPARRSGRSSSEDTQRASRTFARCRRMAGVAC